MKEVIEMYIIWLIVSVSIGALLGSDSAKYENHSFINEIIIIVFGLFLIIPWLPIIGIVWLYYRIIKKKNIFYDI